MAKPEPNSPSLIWQVIKTVIYVLLLGVPSNYARRLMKADWVSVSAYMKRTNDTWLITCYEFIVVKQAQMVRPTKGLGWIFEELNQRMEFD